MVTLTLHTSNCDAANFYKIEELATAELELRLEFDRIVSIQSQRTARDELCSAIQEQLLPFEWICAGPVNLELLWYLHGTQRQETDKVGDIDNITKPIIDSLTGERGLLIDDSQIGSLHTFWNSRNHLTQKDALYIRLQFNNDECLRKDDLVFVQYIGAVCLPLNVDFNSIKGMVGALFLIRARLFHRRTAEKLKALDQESIACSSYLHGMSIARDLEDLTVPRFLGCQSFVPNVTRADFHGADCFVTCVKRREDAPNNSFKPMPLRGTA